MRGFSARREVVQSGSAALKRDSCPQPSHEMGWGVRRRVPGPSASSCPQRGQGALKAATEYRSVQRRRPMMTAPIRAAAIQGAWGGTMPTTGVNRRNPPDTLAVLPSLQAAERGITSRSASTASWPKRLSRPRTHKDPQSGSSRASRTVAGAASGGGRVSDMSGEDSPTPGVLPRPDVPLGRPARVPRRSR